MSTHAIHIYQCQDHGGLVLEDVGSLDSFMSHSHRKVEVTQFVQDPEVHGGIPAIMSFHVYQ